MEQMERNIEQQETQETRTPDRAAYIQRINELTAEEQAFMEGYLYAKVTDAARKGA